MDFKGCFIDGRWVATPERLEVVSPWSGEVVGGCAGPGPGEWEAAITASQRAAATLRQMSSQERRQMLEGLVAGVKASQAELAQLIVAEGGKPVTYARGEVSRGVTTLSLAAEEAARLGGEVLPLDLTRASAGRWGITRRFPVGPVLGITPFNFPFNLVAHKVGPALAAGNPIIIKPASACPLTALKLAEIWDQAGLPAGGLQVLPSSSRLAEAAVADERFKVLSFTGSAAVGWDLKSQGRQENGSSWSWGATPPASSMPGRTWPGRRDGPPSAPSPTPARSASRCSDSWCIERSMSPSRRSFWRPSRGKSWRETRPGKRRSSGP